MASYLNQKAAALEHGAIRIMFDKASSMENIISMGIGEPDMKTPDLICDAETEALRLGYTHYTTNAGMPALRSAVANSPFLHNVEYNPKKEIIITCGAMGALSLLFMVILENGDEVLIQDPQWLNYAAQVAYFGGIPVRVPTSAEQHFEMQPEVIESLITPRTKALMINSPNNPTGEIMSGDTLGRIADIAKKHNLFIISDEVYNTLVYDDVKCMSIAEFQDMKAQTIIINSFSKAYAMTGWRIGFAAGPSDIIDRMTKCQENVSSCANAPGQYAAITALEHPELCRSICEKFEKRRRFLIEGFNNIPGIVCGNPKGAFYLFPDIKSFGLSSAEFCNRLLEEAGVVCIPGSAFGSCGEGYMRVSYTCDESKIAEALAHIKEFCGKL